MVTFPRPLAEASCDKPTAAKNRSDLGSDPDDVKACASRSLTGRKAPEHSN